MQIIDLPKSGYDSLLVYDVHNMRTYAKGRDKAEISGPLHLLIEKTIDITGEESLNSYLVSDLVAFCENLHELFCHWGRSSNKRWIRQSTNAHVLLSFTSRMEEIL